MCVFFSLHSLNSCLDLIVPALAVFKAMNLSVPSSTSDSSMIADKEQFAKTFCEFFQRGHAAERSFIDRQLFATFVNAAQSLPDAKVRCDCGNCEVQRIAKIACNACIADIVFVRQKLRRYCV